MARISRSTSARSAAGSAGSTPLGGEDGRGDAGGGEMREGGGEVHDASRRTCAMTSRSVRLTSTRSPATSNANV
jgi:hypothetical protein